MSTQTIKVSIVLSGKFGRHDNAEKSTEPLKFCPCCGADLIPLLDKPSHVTTPPGGPESGGLDRDTPQDSTARGGCYCVQCGTQLLYNDKAADIMAGTLGPPSKPPEEDDVSQTNTDSLTRAMSVTRLGKMLDEEYQTWEERLQSEFQAFLLSVRNHFQKKEKNLQEYQIDLCQREKELQNSEEIYQQKMMVLTESEDELKKQMDNARESVTLQLESNAQAGQNGCQEIGVQTDPVYIEPERSKSQQHLTNLSPGMKQESRDNTEGSYGLYVKSPPNPAIKVPNLSSPPNQQRYTDEKHFRQHNEQHYPSQQQVYKEYQPVGNTEPNGYNPPKDSQRLDISPQSYNQSYSSYSQQPEIRQHSPPTKPGYHQQSTYQQHSSKPHYHQQPISQENKTTYSYNKPNSSFQQSPPFSYSSTSSQLESAQDQSSSRSSNVPAQSSRIVTSPGSTSMTANTSIPTHNPADQTDGASEFHHFQRSRLEQPPPPLGIAYPQRYNRRSQSAEVLDVYPQRTQSPSPDRENQRSFSADKVESPRMQRHDVSRSQSAERLLDSGFSYSQANRRAQQESAKRKQAPPYNGPPAYSKHAHNYNSTPQNHSRESSVNGHGEGAIIESRTLDVQVARSKSVTDSNIPSPKEKAVKFGVAVFPPKADTVDFPKSSFARPENEAEPDMTSTPVENKEIVFPGAQGDSYDQRPNLKQTQSRPNGSYGYSPSKTQASRIAPPTSRLQPTSYRHSGAVEKNSRPPTQGAQRPESAKQSPYSKYSTPPSNIRRPTPGAPKNQVHQRTPQRADQPQGRGQGVQRRAPQNYAQQSRDLAPKEINNNRPISDFTDDDVFVADTPPSIPAKSPYSSSKIPPPSSSERKSRNITSHHKSRIAQSPRSLSAAKNSNGTTQGISQPRSYPSQQPEPQQPVRQQHYNQSYVADTSNMADDSLSSSILSNSQNRHFDFSPTYKALYHKYHHPSTGRRLNEHSERKRQQEQERENDSPKSPAWRSRSRLPNYGKYISEIQEVPVPTKILDH